MIKGTTQPRLSSAAVLLAVFAMSVAVLVTEISVTRISSIMFSYHYAFVSVATTFAGLGVGGVLGSHLLKKTTRAGLIIPIALSCIVFVFVAFITMLVATGNSTPNFALNTFLFFIMFLPAGSFLSSSYRYLSDRGNMIYAVDVLGASIGSVLVITLLGKFDPVSSVLMAGVALASCLVFTTIASKSKKLVVVNVTLVVVLIAVLSSNSVLNTSINVGVDQGKELQNIIGNPDYGASLRESRWSPFGRTDLVDLEVMPDYKLIFIDGGAGTIMYRFGGDISNVSTTVRELMNTTASFPYYFSGKDDVLIIGPGGGIDVLIGLLFNVTNIHAVEINGDTVDMVKDYSSYNGGIYTSFDSVKIHEDEGRSYLKRAVEKYDAIMLNIPITATLQGTFENSMAENYLFTVESMRDYMDHLKDDGFLVIVAHEPLEVYKLLATIVEANGGESMIDQTLKQLVVTQGNQHPPFPVVIMKKTPFSPEESAFMLKKADDLKLVPVFFPYANYAERSRFDPNLVALGNSVSVDDLVTAGIHAGVDLRPPTDDRPFFYKFEVDIPDTFVQLLSASTILAFAGSALYFILGRRKVPKSSDKSTQDTSIFMVFYFASIGVSFMMIEGPLIQKFMLFLGPPTVTISMVLFGLLLWMGVGSLLSRYIGSPREMALKATFLIGLLIILQTVTLPIVFDSLLGLDLFYRLASSFLMLGPAGLLLGIPFSVGMAKLDQEHRGQDVAWMWGINGLFSLLGSNLAASLAMVIGFNATMLIGAGLYLLVSVVGKLNMK